VFDSRAFALGGAHSVRFVPVPRAERAARNLRPVGAPGGPLGAGGPAVGPPYFMNGHPGAVGPMTQQLAATQLTQHFGNFTQVAPNCKCALSLTHHLGILMRVTNLMHGSWAHLPLAQLFLKSVLPCAMSIETRWCSNVPVRYLSLRVICSFVGGSITA
jgi:hypothetical protein